MFNPSGKTAQSIKCTGVPSEIVSMHKKNKIPVSILYTIISLHNPIRMAVLALCKGHKKGVDSYFQINGSEFRL